MKERLNASQTELIRYNEAEILAGLKFQHLLHYLTHLVNNIANLNDRSRQCYKQSG